MRRPCTIAGLVLVLLVPSASRTQAAPAAATSRVIVQLRDDVRFDAFTGDWRPDARLADPVRHGYHSRGVIGAIMALERRHGFRADAFFSRAVKGFAARVTPAQQARLAADPMVATVEPDAPVRLDPLVASTQTIDWGIFKTGADISSTRSGDGTGSVSGVNVYVIDTGIDVTHPDLNVVEHVTMTGDPNSDCYGHGTGVAGIIAAKDNGDFTVGVAPGAPLHGVKVFTCEGLTFPSYIVSGIDWVTAHAIKPAVANMSLGSIVPLTIAQ